MKTFVVYIWLFIASFCMIQKAEAQVVYQQTSTPYWANVNGEKWKVYLIVFEAHSAFEVQENRYRVQLVLPGQQVQESRELNVTEDNEYWQFEFNGVAYAAKTNVGDYGMDMDLRFAGKEYRFTGGSPMSGSWSMVNAVQSNVSETYKYKSAESGHLVYLTYKQGDVWLAWFGSEADKQRVVLCSVTTIEDTHYVVSTNVGFEAGNFGEHLAYKIEFTEKPPKEIFLKMPSGKQVFLIRE